MKRTQSILIILIIVSVCIMLTSCSKQNYETRYDLPNNYEIVGINELSNNKIIMGCKFKNNSQTQFKLLVFNDDLKILKEYIVPGSYDYIYLSGFRYPYNQIAITGLTKKRTSDSLIFDTEIGKVVSIIPDSSFVVQLNGISTSFSPDSKYALVSKRKDGLCVYDIENNKIIGSYKPFKALSISCKWNNDRSINWLDRYTQKSITWFPNKPTIIKNTSLEKFNNFNIEQISPDETTLVLSDYSKGYPIIKFANVYDGKITKTYNFTNHKSYKIYNLQWSDDGRYLFVYLADLDNEDTQLLIFSANSLKEVARFSKYCIISGMYTINNKGDSVYICVKNGEKPYKESIFKLKLKCDVLFKGGVGKRVSRRNEDME